MRNRVPTEYREQLRREQQAQDDRIALASAPRRGGGGSVTAGGVSYDPTASGMAATNVQTAIDELDAQKLADAPSDGSTYGRKNGAWAVATGSGGGMTLVGSAVVAGAAATTLTVSGLDLAADGEYLVFYSLNNATASVCQFSLFYSGDTTVGNYARDIDGARALDALFSGAAASSCVTGNLSISQDQVGKPRATGLSCWGEAAALSLQRVAHMRNIVGNVTSITISASVANALAVGSHIKIYRMGG